MLIAMPLLALTHRHFPLTSLLYLCITLHAMVLMLGGAYTYARVPLGFELQQWLELSRNPYDKIGHFFRALCPPWCAGRSCCAGLCAGPAHAGVSGGLRGARHQRHLRVHRMGAAIALGQGRMSFSAPRATPGIPSPTCSSP